MNPTTGEVVDKVAWSSPTIRGDRVGVGIPTVSAVKVDDLVIVNIAGSNPLATPTADIDIAQALGFSSGKVQTWMVGDAFPNVESFIVGPTGEAIMIHTFSTSGPRQLGPYMYLPMIGPGAGVRDMGRSEAGIGW